MRSLTNGLAGRAAIALLVALQCGMAVSARGAESVDALLRSLSEVHREAQGNLAAQKAWKQLAEVPPAELPKLLAALDGASPLAANWIRSAIESLVDHTLAAGQKLPSDALEAFIAQRSHAPRARRLAFECLAKADPTAGDRLIPEMLADPSNEFRRDAVERLLMQANSQLEAKQNDAAQQTLLTALTGARDLDQVELITQKLKSLGKEVDLARHFGFLMQWKLIGPFDNTNTGGFDVAYPPEAAIDLAGKYPGKGQEVAWIDFATSDRLGDVDLNTALGKHKGAAAYALATFESAEARPIELRLGCVTANKLWLNGELLGANDFYHAGAHFDQYVFRGRLKAGPNLILLKICQNEQTESWAQVWNFQLRVCDATGTAVLSSDRPATTTATAAGGN